MLLFIFIAFTSCTKNETQDNCFGELIKDTTNSFCTAGARVSVVKGDFTLSEKSQKRSLVLWEEYINIT
jgi:hypothetical protein